MVPVANAVVVSTALMVHGALAALTRDGWLGATGSHLTFFVFIGSSVWSVWDRIRLARQAD